MVLTMPRMVSAVSMPVCPNTPNVIAHTSRSSPKPNSEASTRSMCRVAKIPCAVRGPSASGVTSSLPSPATSTGPSSSGRSVLMLSVIAVSRPSKSSLSCENAGISIVMYLPFGLPSSCAPSSLRISISVTLAFCRAYCRTATLSECFAVISRCSTAKSVRKSIDFPPFFCGFRFSMNKTGKSIADFQKKLAIFRKQW